ncbi:MAG: Chaperone of endosialidase [Segetibacter sp.]|nr:Chaperone of endosialidase [Segetibacter sp.]
MKNIIVLIIFLSIGSKLLSQQYVGIGITNPTARLHVNGPVKLEGLSLLEFGAGVAGKELNAGKIGYNAFGTNALAIVGAGSSTLNRAVYFFAEGGTTFTGPVNVEGSIRVNGNAGVAGQVLTSDGSNDPQWKNAAYSNTTRFAVDFSTSGYNTAIALSSRYNLNATDITIGASNITINKTGLYHLDGFFYFSAAYSSAYVQAFVPVITLSIVTSSGPYTYAENQELVPKTYYVSANPFYSYQQKFNYDLYLVAGTSIYPGRTFNGQLTNGSFLNRGNLSGYLISE